MDEDYLDPLDDCWGEEDEEEDRKWIRYLRMAFIRKIFNL